MGILSNLSCRYNNAVLNGVKGFGVGVVAGAVIGELVSLASWALDSFISTGIDHDKFVQKLCADTNGKCSATYSSGFARAEPNCPYYPDLTKKLVAETAEYDSNYGNILKDHMITFTTFAVPITAAVGGIAGFVKGFCDTPKSSSSELKESLIDRKELRVDVHQETIAPGSLSKSPQAMFTPKKSPVSQSADVSNAKQLRN